MNKLWVNASDDQIRDFILSQEGSTQGAVDGGIFFNCAINEIIQELNKLVLQTGGGVFVAIADDIIGCIKPEAVLPAFQIIEERFRTLNLQLNYEKSTIFANDQETINKVEFDKSATLQKVRTTTEGIVLLGSSISHDIGFHDKFIQSKIDEAKRTLLAITSFGKEYLQQALVLLKSCYISKFSYLSRVTPPHILEPFTTSIMKDIKMGISNMIEHRLTNPQWCQCLLKPRHGGLGIMDISSTSRGAYLASMLACLSNIDGIDKHQDLGLNVLEFDQMGMPSSTNSFQDEIKEQYEHVRILHSKALRIDREASLDVLHKLPSADRKTPGHITPEDRYNRTRAIDLRAAKPFPTVKRLIATNHKLQAMFSDSASKVARSQLLNGLDPESVIRIHSASDEGAACIQTQPTAPNRCFSSLEFKIYVYLRLGIQISKNDTRCPSCSHAQGLSNLHLVNGCKHGEYIHRKHNTIMEQIKSMCNAAKLLVDVETTHCFNDQTYKRMDLVVQINNKDFLIDVTTIDANNPSNGFVKNSELSSSYFPGAAAVIKARQKFSKYKRIIASTKEFVPFVIETQGRWGFHAREIFKSIYAKIPVKASRVSRNYWQQQISLAYMKATLSNIVHKFHIARKNVFGPLAPQELYYFESFYGQI